MSHYKRDVNGNFCVSVLKSQYCYQLLEQEVEESNGFAGRKRQRWVNEFSGMAH